MDYIKWVINFLIISITSLGSDFRKRWPTVFGIVVGIDLIPGSLDTGFNRLLTSSEKSGREALTKKYGKERLVNCTDSDHGRASLRKPIPDSRQPHRVESRWSNNRSSVVE